MENMYNIVMNNDVSEEIKALEASLESLEIMEKTNLDLKDTFKKLIDETLDAYNDGEVPTKIMKFYLKMGNEKLAIVDQNLREIIELKEHTNKLIFSLKEDSGYFK